MSCCVPPQYEEDLVVHPRDRRPVDRTQREQEQGYYYLGLPTSKKIAADAEKAEQIAAEAKKEKAEFDALTQKEQEQIAADAEKAEQIAAEAKKEKWRFRLSRRMGGSKYDGIRFGDGTYKVYTKNGPPLPAGIILIETDEVGEKGGPVLRTAAKDGKIFPKDHKFAWRMELNKDMWGMFWRNQTESSHFSLGGDRTNPLAIGKDGRSWGTDSWFGYRHPPQFEDITQKEHFEALELELRTLAGDRYLVNSWFAWTATPTELLELLKQAAAAQHQELAGALLAPARASRGLLCCYRPATPAKYTVPWQLVAPGVGGGAVLTALDDEMLGALAALPQQHLLVLFDSDTAASEEPATAVVLGTESIV